MKILNLLTSGETGGIESLCRDIGQYSEFENVFCFLTAGGDVCEQMALMNMDVRKLYPLGRKFSIRKIRALCKISKECDIVTVHHGDPFLKVYFIILKYLTNKKMVSVIHSCYDEVFFKGYGKCKRWVAEAIYNKSLRVSDKVIYVSEAGKTTYIEHFGKLGENNSRVVYNGISPRFIMQGLGNQLRQCEPYNLMYIGRLSEIKGLTYLLEAVAIVRKKWNVRLIIVGDGNYRTTLVKQCKNLCIDEIVLFEGQQLNVAPYLEKATAFIYPSTCMEVFGISIVEAMAYGIPCIGSNVGGIPEIIKDGTNGWLAKSGSSYDVAQKIDLLLNKIKNNTIMEIIDAGRETAKRFSIMNTVNQLKHEYEGLIVMPEK